MTARLLCVGTHHKTGTVWMRKIFRSVADHQAIPYMQCYRPKRLADIPETGPMIIVNWSSSFPRALMDRSDARFLHLIRDPRDVLLSGMRYHRVAPLANEKFLRERSPALGGMTYQSFINALPNDLERLMFEMEQKHDQTVKEMLAWPYNHPNSVELRYETLVEDVTCSILRNALRGFNIVGLDIDHTMQAYWKHSLFGALGRRRARNKSHMPHIRSGSKAQWVTSLPREIAVPYAKRYGAALRRLGYEQDETWVDQCLPARQIAANAA